MLVKVTGDRAALANAQPDARLNWRLDDDKPVGSAQQIGKLLTLLGIVPGNTGAGLPPEYTLYKGLSRDQKGELLRTDKPPAFNGLRPNCYIYVGYEQRTERTPSIGGVVGEQEGVPSPNAFAGKSVPYRGRRHQPVEEAGFGNEMNELLQEKQTMVESLGRRLQTAETANRDLKRQVIQLTEQLSSRPSFNHHQHASVVSPPSKSDRSPSATSNSYQDVESATRLRDQNRILHADLNATLAELNRVRSQLETMEAWKSQHDCSKTGVKTSDLRQDISDMKNTLRDVVRHREETKEGLTIRKRELEDRFNSQKSAGNNLMKEASLGIGGDLGTQLMPSPYYMDPHTAPASVYQQGPGLSEGSICKLKVQTLTGEGTVVRRIYSAVTRNNQHVLILASLEGVVTDEIVALELEKAGAGYNRPDLLFLATAKHRWVLSMEPEERKKWLDWLVQTNTSLASVGASGTPRRVTPL